MNNQDWTTIVFKKKPQSTFNNATPKEVTPKYNAGRNTQRQHVNAYMVEKKADDGNLTTAKVSYNLQIQIQQARQAKNLTQKQLAHTCNIPVTTIRDYENGTATPKSQDLNKMSKALGVILRNKI